LTSNNFILQAVVTESMQDLQCNKTYWFICVIDLLARHWFYQVWLNPHAISVKVFINTFRQRLLHVDNYVQEWNNNNVVSNNVLTLYKQTYLGSSITKLRLCAPNLRIHTGRYEHLDRNVRYCQVCNIHEIKDEFHFVFKCPLYTCGQF